MSESPGVTIVVANYNYELFLAAAIDGALGQNHPHCEVSAVDDCSTDNSVAVIEGYGVVRDAQVGAGYAAFDLTMRSAVMTLTSMIWAAASSVISPRSAHSLSR